jgi:hypothetical protein
MIVEDHHGLSHHIRALNHQILDAPVVETFSPSERRLKSLGENRKENWVVYWLDGLYACLGNGNLHICLSASLGLRMLLV